MSMPSIGRYRGPMPSPWGSVTNVHAIMDGQIGRWRGLSFVVLLPYRARKQWWRAYYRGQEVV